MSVKFDWLDERLNNLAYELQEVKRELEEVKRLLAQLEKVVEKEKQLTREICRFLFHIYGENACNVEVA